MIKLVFVITKSEIGGAQTWVNQLRLLFENEYDIYLITSERGWLTEQFDQAKVKIIPSIASLKKIWAAFHIQKYLRSINADVVISNSANAGIYARIAKLFYSHKSIYVSHGWSCIYNGGNSKKIFCNIERIFSYITDHIICVSLSDKDKAREIIGISEEKLVVIRNCILPLPPKKHVNDKKKILYLGRMAYPKRPDLIAQVVSEMPEVEIHLVGDGPYFGLLNEQYKAFENIIFKGAVKGFSDFQSYDIFVLCSDSEGLPMSAIEAASAGLPLLLSNVGGCYELIFNDCMGNKNGELFSNEAEELKLQLNSMINNYSDYYTSAVKVKHVFNINEVSNEYKILFRK